jgi:hypothetical protein
MCGTSSSIDEMIVWRAIQDFIGGSMIPTVFATAFIVFPLAVLHQCAAGHRRHAHGSRAD